MQERFCACGSKLSSINSSPNCRPCREKIRRERSQAAREAKQRERMSLQRKSGLVLLHRCLSRPENPFETNCTCRKWIPFAEAKAMVAGGHAVDFVTRKPLFAEREILEVGLLKSPPRSSLGGMIASERLAVLGDKTFDPGELQRLETAAKEENEWRRLESIVKVDVEAQLTRAVTCPPYLVQS